MGEDVDKLGERAVVGLLHLRGEDAGGELIELQMVGDALAALTFSGARLIGAGAFGFVDFNLTFHRV